VGEEPLAGELGEVDDRAEAVVEVVEGQGLGGRGAGDEVQAGEHGDIVGRGVGGEVLDGLEEEHVAVVGLRQAEALDVVEAALVHERDLVGDQAGDVGVDGGVLAGERLDGDELDLGPDDDAELAEAAAHGVEQADVVAGRALAELALAGDDPQLEHVVGLEAVLGGLAADAADGEGAADAEVDVVGEDGRALAEREGLLEELEPADAGVDDGVVGVDGVDLREAGHVDDEAALGLRLALGAVAVADHAHRADLDAVLVGELDRPDDIGDGGGDQHRERGLADDVTPVVGRGGAVAGGGEEDAVEAGDSDGVGGGLRAG
jgi:hypothetical protein